MTIPKLPPHALAMGLGRVHGCCHLCGGHITHHESSHGRVLLDTPLLCLACHHHVITPLPVFGVPSSVGVLPLSVGAYYDMPLNRVMARFKDKGNVGALMVLYHVLKQLPKPKHTHHAVLIPTPTTDKRLIKRGFHAVMILTKFLSYLWQIPIYHGLKRHENDIRQRGLSRDERLVNVRQDFYLTDELTARHAILVDDVVTTGATLSAIAEMIIAQHPAIQLSLVGVLHGKADIHLSNY